MQEPDQAAEVRGEETVRVMVAATGGVHVTAAFGPVHAPDFTEGLDWLNVPGPLRLSDLRGRLVLLDFWTYG